MNQTYETCALKEIDYYEDKCPHCNGDCSNICYVTKKAIRDHLKDFHRIFLAKMDRANSDEDEEKIGRLDDIDQQFQFANFGMGFAEEVGRGR